MKRVLLFLLVCGTIFGQNEIVRKLQLVDSLNKKIFYSDTTSLIPTKIFLSQNHYTKSATNTLLGAKLDTTLATSTLRTQWSAGYSHSLLTNNPHSVTATQVGLGNVTNESKATMFTNSTFTGNTIANNLALGGATIGTNALAVTGNGYFSGKIKLGVETDISNEYDGLYIVTPNISDLVGRGINVKTTYSGAYGSTGINSYFYTSGNTTLDHIHNYQSQIFHQGTSTLPFVANYWSYNDNSAATGAWTNAYGFYHRGSSGVIANAWAFYSFGNNASRLGGKLYIGDVEKTTASLPNSNLYVTYPHATITGGLSSPTITLHSTNTAAVGVGASIALGGESAAGTTPYNFAFILGAKETAGATYNGYMAFYTTDTGSNNSEKARITSSGALLVGYTSDPTSGNKFAVNGASYFNGVSVHKDYIQIAPTTGAGAIYIQSATSSNNSVVNFRSSSSTAWTIGRNGTSTAFNINFNDESLASGNLLSITTTGATSIATSLAIGGATIGTNALAVTGTSLFSNTLTVSSGGLVSTGGYALISSGASTQGMGASGVDTYIRGANIYLQATSGGSTYLTLATGSGNATFAGSVLHPNGSAASPSISFSGATAYGFYYDGGLNVSVNGTKKYEFGSSVFNLLDNSGAIRLGTNSDVVLIRDAANTLALRNGVNAQTFNIYNSYTDASNYERGSLVWSSNLLSLSTSQAGTGTARNIAINPSGGKIYFQTNGTTVFISESGVVYPSAATIDLGSTAKKWRTGYFGTSVITPAINNGGSNLTVADNIYPGTDNTYYLGKNDDDTPLAYKGLILKDTTNGKYYRIEIISGVITATDLTD